MERVGTSGHEGTVSDGYGWDRSWVGWHVDWGAVWLGALAGVVAAVLLGLLATAVGAHKAVDDRVLKFADVGPVTIIFSVLGAFLAAALGEEYEDAPPVGLIGPAVDQRRLDEPVDDLGERRGRDHGVGRDLGHRMTLAVREQVEYPPLLQIWPPRAQRLLDGAADPVPGAAHQKAECDGHGVLLRCSTITHIDGPPFWNGR